MSIIERDIATFELHENGIIWVRYRDNSFLTIDDCEGILSVIEELSAGTKRGFILDSRGVFVSTTPEYREFMGSDPRALRWRKADAILVDFLPNRILSNAYRVNYVELHPIELFDKEEDAFAWLHNF